MESVQGYIDIAKNGFEPLKVGQQFKDFALKNIAIWLTDSVFETYQPQIKHLIESGHFEYLLDCFYQVIPFGTGGRRGEVGIGPNRINTWTIQASAQGHSQYLIKQYGDAAKTRGVVLAYDVRQFFSNKYFNDSLPNPVRNLNCNDLAKSAAVVYAANGIKVYIFDGIRTTPELSFAVRHLKCVGGDVFSASHNPPEHNGKKVYDEFGGQLIPPFDEALVTEVTENAKDIHIVSFEEAEKNGTIITIGKEVDDAYISTCLELSLSTNRSAKIVYTPLHGCGNTSVLKVLNAAGFDVTPDPKTSNPSGKFENVTFNIPNPEVIQSFDRPLEFAKTVDADIILNSDPDADRIGVMANHHGEWHFFNGNEIGAMLTRYVIEKKQSKLTGKGVVIKTQVTTNLISEICKKNNVDLVGDLLVGFKFVGDIMNQLEVEGRMENFLMGCEESHGYVAGNYIREKDAVPAAIWLAELAGELKEQDKTLFDYLNDTYSQYGYFRNFLTEIRLPGAEGMGQIQHIQASMRTSPPSQWGNFNIDHVEDWLDRKPFVSETDKVAKNGLVFFFKALPGTTSIKVSLRPSGTEPKIKMYYEIGSEPFPMDQIEEIKSKTELLLKDLEKSFMKACYKVLGVDFPDRGFLLFWQLPLVDKMKYFEIEPKIETLKSIANKSERVEELTKLFAFLGSDPIQKVNDAFKAKYGETIEKYLNLE